MDEKHDNPPVHYRVWQTERRLDDAEKRLDKLEARAERLEQRPYLNGLTKPLIYVLVMVIVALITGTSVNLSGLLK